MLTARMCRTALGSLAEGRRRSVAVVAQHLCPTSTFPVANRVTRNTRFPEHVDIERRCYSAALLPRYRINAQRILMDAEPRKRSMLPIDLLSSMHLAGGYSVTRNPMTWEPCCQLHDWQSVQASDVSADVDLLGPGESEEQSCPQPSSCFGVFSHRRSGIHMQTCGYFASA